MIARDAATAQRIVDTWWSPTDTSPTFVAITLDPPASGHPSVSPGTRIASISVAKRHSDPAEAAQLTIPLVGPDAAEMGAVTPLLGLLQRERLGAYNVGAVALWLSARFGLHRLNWVEDPWIGSRLTGITADDGTALVKRCLGIDGTSPEQFPYAALTLAAFFEPMLRGRFRAYRDDVRTHAAMAEAWSGGAIVVSPLDEMDTISQRLADVSVRVYQALGSEPFVIGSPTQLAAAFARAGVHTPFQTLTGKPRWDRETIHTLRHQHPAVALVGEFRTLAYQLAELRGLHTDGSLGTVAPYWEPNAPDGRSTMEARRPNVERLSHHARQFFRAEFRQRWVTLHWPRETAVWWMLGWTSPWDVESGLNDWAAVARHCGMTEDALSAVAVQWVLRPQSTSAAGWPFDWADGLDEAPPARAVEAALMAFKHTWGDLIVWAQGQKDAIPVNGVHGPYMAPWGGDTGTEWRRLVRNVAADLYWSATKKMILLLWDYQRGHNFLPDGRALSFTTRCTPDQIAETLSPFVFPMRPPCAPSLQEGASWGESSRD